MSAFDDGGPAFPRPASEYTRDGTLADGNQARDDQEGMTVADYAAVQIMAGLVSGLCMRQPELSISDDTKDLRFWAKEAKMAYAAAHALTAERRRGGS